MRSWASAVVAMSRWHSESCASFYGDPRSTVDIDFTVMTAREPLERLYELEDDFYVPRPARSSDAAIARVVSSSASTSADRICLRASLMRSPAAPIFGATRSRSRVAIASVSQSLLTRHLPVR